MRQRWAIAMVTMIACSGNDAAPEPACVYLLNRPRTILDADLDCPSAPERVICSGVEAADSIRPSEFMARYHPDGRLAGYGWSDDGWTELDYFADGRLHSIGEVDLTYDLEERLASVEVRGVVRRTFHYDERDRLIRIEDPMGYHGTTHFEWSDDGWLEQMRSEGDRVVTQTFTPDEEGRLARHVVQDEGSEPVVRDFHYEDGDLVQMDGRRISYTDRRLDVPITEGLHEAWFIKGAQKEMFIRTGSLEQPWRVYLGDHPSGWVAAYPEYLPVHRPSGNYGSGDDGAISATVSSGNTHHLDFAPVSHCSAE